MTPAFDGWKEDDYYAARDRARRAFDRTNQQLSLDALEEGVKRAAGAGTVAAAAPSSSASPDPAATLPLGAGGALAGRPSSGAERASLDLTLDPGATPGVGSQRNRRPGSTSERDVGLPGQEVTL